MANTVLRASLVNSIYFSSASFLIIWIAGTLYELLEKTPGQLNQGVVIIIVLGLVLILLALALTNIFIGGPDNAGMRFSQRLLGAFVFLLASVLILSILGVLFWFPI